VRHFNITPRGIEQIHPFALRPRDFAEEWLSRDWSEAAFWMEDANRAAASAWHVAVHKDVVSGEFHYPTLHCPARPDLWQVGVDFSEPKKALYFLIRWRPPYRFTMVDVSERPSPACTDEDRAQDDGDLYPTLFPPR
jgi:hypothetical protein